MTTEKQKQSTQDADVQFAENSVNQADSAAEQAIEGTLVDDAGSVEDAGQSNEASEESVNTQIEALQLQLEQAKEQMLRAHADAQNARRRAEQDVEKAHKFALEKFARELLPVIDSLERALDIFGQHDVADAVKEGVEMTLNMFVSTLGKFNVEQINPQGEPFDPQFHEAMSMVPNPDVEPNTVIAVMQKGYLLNGRLVRPAMVMVSRAS